MIEKYYADSKEKRTKKATEITSLTDQFVPHISDYPITMPPIMPAALGVYSGLTDPLDFLQGFKGVVSTYNWEEPVACRVFPMVLHGLAWEWFHNLNARSIIGFIDLREKFLMQFQNLLPQKKTHIECHDINQGFKKTLGGLLTRYTYKCQKIPNLHEDQNISGFVHAINPITEENNNGGYARNDQQRNNDDNGNHGYHNRNRNSSKKWSNDSFSIIQTLSKMPKEILMQESIARTFPDPPPLPENNRHDKSKFCVFHDDYGYDTNRCRDFVELIAEATTQEKLDCLDKTTSTTNAQIAPNLSNTPRTPDATMQQERKAHAVKNLGAKIVGKKENLQEIQVINMVHINKNAHKRKADKTLEKWQFAPITFPPVQDCGLSEVPIIISCKIANTGILIMKVHVDTGSSVDVMYEQCFHILPEDIKAKLKPMAVSLSGFSREFTWPLGQLELNIELVDETDAKLTRQAWINLYVMWSTSHFNVLLGHTALCKLGVISSTIHGMVKFATCKGTATMNSAEAEPICASITAQENVGIKGHMIVTNRIVSKQISSTFNKNEKTKTLQEMA
ncbi:uncharacterized protein [Rutidosis leptorrhynchoides]|uniref:uncharacterized protein n=1 Tax=Rutidosis leptorrhynchoides TaxID=125765 RepID=UPI003A98F11D